MNASESQSSSDTVMMMMDIDPPLHHHPLPSAASSSSMQQAMAASGSRKPLSSEDVDMNGGEGSGASSSSRGAGPSTLPFYTMAPVRHGPPHLRMRLHPSQDLITRLGLLPAFDDLVRPFIRVPTTTTTAEGGADGADEKGKGKEVDIGSGRMQGVEGPEGQQASATTGVGSSAKPEGGDENKKEHKNGWRSLVQPQISGKFSTKKDTYLGDLTTYQPRPPMKIRPFDLGTLNGFRLEEGQLDAATLQLLGLGPDEKKKKKKKKKVLADGTAATADSSAGGVGSSQTGATPAGINGSGGGTPRPSSNQVAPSPRPAIHPAYLKANSPYPQSNRPPSVQTPTQPPATFGTGGGASGGNYWHGQPVPPEANGMPKPPGATSVMVNGKAARVRKERDEGPGTPGPSTAQAQAGGQAPRPHKKRKMDGSGSGPSAGPSQHHGMAAHHQQQQPMQQATPTF